MEIEFSGKDGERRKAFLGIRRSGHMSKPLSSLPRKKRRFSRHNEILGIASLFAM
jgi:hypothetical protein